MSKSPQLTRGSRWQDRILRWATLHPRTVLSVAGALTVLAILVLPSLTLDVDFSNYLNRKDPAVIAADEAKERFGSQLRVLVAIEDEQGIFRTETLKAIERLERELDALPEVEDRVGPLSAQVIRGTERALHVRSAAPEGKAPATPSGLEAYQRLVLDDRALIDYVVSSTGKAAAIYLKPVADVEMVDFAKAIETVVLAHADEGIGLHISGVPYVNLTLQRSMRRDLRVFLPLVILVIIGVLYISFRWTWGVLLPFTVVAFSVLWTLGLMAVFGVPITLLSFILPVVLMAIGIADGIHVLSRYREELLQYEDKTTAILETLRAMRRPVVLTSLTTAAGFLSLLNAYMVPQRAFGLFTALGILFAMLLSLLLIPAVLQLVRPPRARTTSAHSWLARGLGAVVGRAIRYRRAVLIGGVILAMAFSAGIPLLRIETAQRAFLGERHPAVRSMDRLDALFAGSNQIMIEVDSGIRDGLKEPDLLNELVQLEVFLASRGVTKTISLTHIVREMNQRFHADDPAYYAIPEERSTVSQLLLLFSFQGGDLGGLTLSDYSAGEVLGFHGLKSGEEQRALVHDVMAYLEAHFDETASVRMAGPTRIQASMFSSIARSQLTSLLTSIAAAALIVIVLMRSVSAGVVSMLPLFFTVLFNFGVMAFAGKSLDIATLMISSITIGIGIDYGIHFIERFREERAEEVSRAEALIHAGSTTGAGILYNALALALGFGVMLLSAFQGLQNFGLLIAMTMVVSAVSSFFVIPAIMAEKGFKRKSDGSRRH